MISEMLYRSSFLQCTLLTTCWFTSIKGIETTHEDLHENYTYNPVTSETEEQLSDRVRYLENVDKLVWIIFAPILLVVGLTGNTLSVLVLGRYVNLIFCNEVVPAESFLRQFYGTNRSKIDENNAITHHEIFSNIHQSMEFFPKLCNLIWLLESILKGLLVVWN